MTDSDPPHASRATQPLQELREILEAVKGSGDAARVHAALIDVVDGLIGHAQRQARAIDDLRSDMSHKQGIVSGIAGGAREPAGRRLEPVRSADDALDL